MRFKDAGEAFYLSESLVEWSLTVDSRNTFPLIVDV